MPFYGKEALFLQKTIQQKIKSKYRP